MAETSIAAGSVGLFGEGGGELRWMSQEMSSSGGLWAMDKPLPWEHAGEERVEGELWTDVAWFFGRGRISLMRARTSATAKPLALAAC